MYDWLPQTEPKRTLTIFALVAALAVVVIVPLSLADGDDGIREAVQEARDSTPTSTPAYTPPPPPPATAPSQPPPPPPPPLPPEPPKRRPRELPLGQTGSDDGVEFTVRSITAVKRIEREAYYKTDFRPKAGGKLIAVVVSYTNRTKRSIDPFCGGGSIELADSRRSKHETIDELFSIEGNDPICNGDDGIKPGARTTVLLAFRLKKGRSVSHVDVWNSQHRPDFDGDATRLRYRP